VNKEQRIALVAVLFPCLVFANGAYQAYATNIEHNTQIKIFDKQSFTKNGETQTLILTYGKGKFFFIGNWTNQLHLDHTYNVTYVQRDPSNHQWNNLIVIKWSETQ